MKDYDVLNELVPKTQELHRAIFDKGYEQGQKEALEQQPCDDCISRQAAIDVIYDNEYKKDMRKELEQLPPVTPKEKTGWIPVTYRLMTEEEKKYYEEYTDCDLTEIFDCPMPEDGQEILISISGGYVCADVCSLDDKYGVGLESHDSWEDVIAWMPLPEPYVPDINVGEIVESEDK